MHHDPFDPLPPFAGGGRAGASASGAGGEPRPDPQEFAPPRIDSRASFRAAVIWGVERAIAQGARRLTWSDPDFGSWPLDDPALLDVLAGWLRRPDRQLTLLAATFDELPRRHPRFVDWRRSWAHVVHGWQAPEDIAAGLPTLMHDDGSVLVRLVDSARWHGKASLDAREARLARDETDAFLQRSEPSFAANPLGL